MRVINLRDSDEKEYVYVGQADSEHGLEASALGNPFTVEQFGRAKCIELYRRWLWEKIKAEDALVLAALSAIDEDSVLACWCKPEACHGDVVVRAWEWVRENRPELLVSREQTVKSDSDLPCGWLGTVGDFLREDSKAIEACLIEHLRTSLGMEPGESQLYAWQNSIEILKNSLASVVSSNSTADRWFVILEYELPRERGRRPDVILLAGGNVLVVEFKGDRFVRPSQLDQVAAYVRDIQNYHAVSHDHLVYSVLVVAGASGFMEAGGGIYRTSPDMLSSVITEITSGRLDEQIDGVEWVQSDYAPLPSLVSAARIIFEHDPLPFIRRAQSAGIPEAVDGLIEAAEVTRSGRAHHLALVTGVPGAGKTLVGLQFVYHSHFEQEEGDRAVFLSGNGPLVSVLQHALNSRVFVQDVHGFLRQYGGARSGSPDEQIIVFDEAQRAWDAQRVNQKRNHNFSEPEDFLRIGKRHEWSLMVGLIGEGQEIHLGEESGLGQWNDAIEAVGGDWTVHCPQHIAPLFTKASLINVNDDLNLTMTLRSHLAADIQLWVEQLLYGDLAAAEILAKDVVSQGFAMYLTRDIEQAKAYLQERYRGQEEKRFGLLASSKAKNLLRYGVNNSFNYTRRLRVGPWYNDPPSSPDSCCQLREVATEFSCQGLELDFPLVSWGDDLWWSEGGWVSKSGGRSQARDPHQLRLNSYRVLLTRGRDGMVVYVPPETKMESIYDALRAAGMRDLE